MTKIDGGIQRIQVPEAKPAKVGINPQPAAAPEPQAERFADMLQKATGASPGLPELKFSAHAKARLQSRNIELSPEELLKMREAIGKARDKGSKESLILSDQAAFVVSVKNNTVITAMDKDSLKENVFTNIDSTIMI